MRNTTFRQRSSERGQTILLIAAALVSLLAMAALAIDVVTLYVARSEIQRAADAAALAGAKGIADSGITTLQTSDGNYANAEVLAQSLATAAITAILQTNLVAGQVPTVTGTPTPNYTHPNNPYITVTLTQGNLPTFFARIWGAGASTVKATATAEVYNPSNTSPAPYTPITPSSVKPWLVANHDPARSGTPFIDPVTGNVIAGVGDQFDLQADCNTSGSTCVLTVLTPTYSSTSTPPWVHYVPAQVTPSTANVCPTSACTGSAYEEAIFCADVKPYSCGGTVPNANWDSTVNPVSTGTHYSATATQCLITNGTGSGQDSLAPILPGFSSPPQITGGIATSPAPGSLVSTSVSIVTIPIIFTCNSGPACFPAGTLYPPYTLTVIGFLQAFVNQVQPNDNINITVLNVSGCGTTQNGANDVVGGSGTSPVPVRLIATPTS